MIPRSVPSRLLALALLLVPAALPAADAAKAPKGAGKKAGPAAPALRIRVQQLHVDNNEGCAVADFNRDGKPDISAGEFWYEGPDFKTKRQLRKLEPFGKDYMTNCGEHAYDVNGDGFPDIVTGAFMDSKVYWYENPGAAGLKSGSLWKQHVLVETKLTQNEWTALRDMDGDGVPEYVVNSYGPANAMMAYRFAKGAGGEPVLAPWLIQPGAPFVNGHGIGFGDINGDGREDLIYGNGWYERPATGAASQPWRRHADWTWPHASTPMIVVDLTGDGRNDIIWGHGHNYGLYWEEQRDPNKDGSTNWRHHVIDDKISQNHCLVWEDIDNDGKPELITGRRVRAHSGGDPGDNEPGCVAMYKWNAAEKRFTKHMLADGGPGTGLQIRVSDLDGNGWKDIVCAGKSGTHILWNDGSTNWRHYVIDDKISQNHCLVWEDIDNDGKPELITGRRVRAHSGGDPGDNEPGCVAMYKWNAAEKRFTRHMLADGGPGTGLQIRVADLDGNGWKDIICAGKSGTHILWNDGR